MYIANFHFLPDFSTKISTLLIRLKKLTRVDWISSNCKRVYMRFTCLNKFWTAHPLSLDMWVPYDELSHNYCRQQIARDPNLVKVAISNLWLPHSCNIS
jgi:hypothetical protein